MRSVLTASLTAVLALAAMASGAQDFRRFDPIARPSAPPPGFDNVETIEPVDANTARAAGQALMQAWNEGSLDQHLADDFMDRDRLLDSMVEDVPRDASVRVLSVRAPQTLSQMTGRATDGARVRVSTVSMTAETQIEFNDPVRGFRVLRGENELILRITEELVP